MSVRPRKAWLDSVKEQVNSWGLSCEDRQVESQWSRKVKLEPAHV